MTDTARYDLALPGCTPEPLMTYLKALGILRLVSEQKDEGARGWWKDDLFLLRSKLDRHLLLKFLLEEYKPTPILAPWNAGSGFYLKWDEKNGVFKTREASDALTEIESSKTKRFQPYRDQIRAVIQGLKGLAKQVDVNGQIAEKRAQGRRERWSKKKTDAQVKKLLDSQMLFATDGFIFAIGKVDKDELILQTRSALLNDEAVRWIDAAYVIRSGQQKNRIEAPLLGSGGNIGNSDFSARFMQILAFCLPVDESNFDGEDTPRFLCNSLFGDPTPDLFKMAVDQFDPGRAGGANMQQGMEADFRLNPWDYIFMVEGAIALQTASSKRLGTNISASAFPFTVDSTSSGFISSGSDTTRGEQWLPIWERACTNLEIHALLAEGRSELGGRSVRTGVEFARAATSLGVDRGIKQFVRIQYQARFGDNYLANALGRVETVYRPSVDLLREIDPWLNTFRRAAGDKDAPPRFGQAVRRIDTAIFDFCKYGGASHFQMILVALGLAERELLCSAQFREKKGIRPLEGLSPEWITAANDDSEEFYVALGLATIDDVEQRIGPLRANLEPVDWKKGCRAWAERDRCVVWNSADLGTDMAKVLQRRVMDSNRAGCRYLALASRFGVPLAMVASFLDGALDDNRIEQLLWGLTLVKRNRQTAQVRGSDRRSAHSGIPLQREYALLKLLCLPRPLVPERSGDSFRWRLARRLENDRMETGLTIRPEPRILTLLQAGRIGEACRLSAHRLRVSGLRPMPVPVQGRVQDTAWDELNSYSTDSRRGTRLAAALLIPISSRSVNDLIDLICRDQSTGVEELAATMEGESI